MQHNLTSAYLVPMWPNLTISPKLNLTQPNPIPNLTKTNFAQPQVVEHWDDV